MGDGGSDVCAFCQAVHGEKGGAAIFCFDHRDEIKHEDVVNVMCKIAGCGKRASFGVPKGEEISQKFTSPSLSSC